MLIIPFLLHQLFWNNIEGPLFQDKWFGFVVDTAMRIAKAGSNKTAFSLGCRITNSNLQPEDFIPVRHWKGADKCPSSLWWRAGHCSYIAPLSLLGFSKRWRDLFLVTGGAHPRRGRKRPVGNGWQWQLSGGGWICDVPERKPMGANKKERMPRRLYRLLTVLWKNM